MLSKLILMFILVIAIVLTSYYVLLQHLEATPFHGDESGWIAAGNYYADLLLKRDFAWDKWECWQCGSSAGTWGGMNPPLGKLLFGIPLALHAEVSSEHQKFSSYYDFSISQEENAGAGNIPPQEILLKTRRVSLLFGVLCGLLLFFLGYYSANWQVGTIASLLLLTNSIFVQHATRAMPDVFNGFLLLSACLVGVSLLVVQHNGYMLAISAFYGILVALAGSVKITSLITGGLFFFTILALKQNNLKLPRKQFVLHLATFAFVAIWVTYTINPYYWPSFDRFTLRGTSEEFWKFSQEVYEGSIRKEDLKQLYPETIRDLTSSDLQRESLRQRYPQLSDLSHPLEFLISYLRWSKWLTYLAAINGDTWNGNRWMVIHKTSVVENSTLLGGYIFFSIGIVVSCISIVRSFTRKKVDRVAVPFTFFIINYLFILAFIKLNEDRWYLPTILASQLIVAIGVNTVITILVEYFKLGVAKLGWQVSHS